jgi:hypothetical protein
MDGERIVRVSGAAESANAFGAPNFLNPGHLCYFPRVIASSITLGGLPVGEIYGFGGKTVVTPLLPTGFSLS